tara:strand:- start:210 stop:806 length:597 start_codon:yes stop_codon:yes gene_type:complete
MASTLKINNLDTASGTTITIPTGKTLIGTDGGSIKAPGSIIQVVQTTPASTTHITFSSTPPTMVEASVALRVTITPKYANSLLRLNFSALIGGRNSGAIMGYKFFDITNSSNVGSSSLGTGSNRTFVNASVRNASSDVNDRIHLNMTAYQAATNTNARTYGIYVYKESGETGDFNMTGTDNAGCSYAPPVFTVEEIAQ